MSNHMNAKSMSLKFAVLASALLVGCAHHDEPAKPETARGQDFMNEAGPSSVGRFTQAQAAAGAKNDSMLYDMHFHGASLNSLGQTKLDLILKASPAGEPVTLYMNMPNELSADRQATVLAYMKNAGLSDSEVKLVDGSNPGKTNPTAFSMPGMYKGTNATFDGTSAELGNTTTISSIGK